MNPALQDAIKEAFAIAPVRSAIYHTLEIRQDTVQAPIYIAKVRRAFEATDEDGHTRLWLACGFDFTLPPSDEEGYQSLNIAIDNIGRAVTNFVETAKSQPVPVEMLYRPFLSDDLTQPQMNPPLLLYLKEVQLNEIQITGKATFADITNKKFPAELYTRERFPTLG